MCVFKEIFLNSNLNKLLFIKNILKINPLSEQKTCKKVKRVCFLLIEWDQGRFHSCKKASPEWDKRTFLFTVWCLLTNIDTFLSM